MCYLDYNATAPLRPEAAERMQALLAEPLNPSSVHRWGRLARKHVEDARRIIADAIGAWPDEIIFTASGTEANNAAMRMQERRVLVSAVEHSSVWRTISSPRRGEARRGAYTAGPNDRFEQASPLPSAFAKASADKNPPPTGEGMSIIPVDHNGIADLSALQQMLSASPHPALVSVMLANNETGVIQPIHEVAALAHAHGALLYCDAVQALGKIPVDIGALGADMLSLSAHKCGGPLGAAALVVRRGVPFVPLLKGGGQEQGRRAGTENVAAIAGFGAAVEQTQDFTHMKQCRAWLDGFEREALAFAPDAMVFGAAVERLPNTSCIAMPGVSAETQLMTFDLAGFAVSAGSACSSGKVAASHVLAAMGVPHETASCAIRVSVGWNTKKEEVEAFCALWKKTCARLSNSYLAGNSCNNS